MQTADRGITGSQ